MTGAVGGGTGASGLATLTVILGLATKGTLVNTTLFRTGERQAHVFQLKHRLGTFATHIFDGVLVADIVGALDCVIHVPAPVIVGVSAGDRTGNATLCGDRV